MLIPLLFMGGHRGRLFHEFAMTLAVTIVISAFVSRGACMPMMCARLLHHQQLARGQFDLKSERAFDWMIGRSRAGH